MTRSGASPWPRRVNGRAAEFNAPRTSWKGRLGAGCAGQCCIAEGRLWGRSRRSKACSPMARLRRFRPFAGAAQMGPRQTLPKSASNGRPKITRWDRPAFDRSRAMFSGPHPSVCRRSGDITTIDCVARACDEAGLLAREIGHQAGDLVGLADTPKRNQRLHHLAVA